MLMLVMTLTVQSECGETGKKCSHTHPGVLPQTTERQRNGGNGTKERPTA